jgi:hypothetical protein
MSVEETQGVASLARILAELGRNDGASVMDLAEKTEVSRSTAFDIIRRLSDAQLIRRRLDGAITAGPAAITLGFAAFGIAPLAGPAETLLAWLHERSDAFAELVAGGASIIAFGKPQHEIHLDAAITDTAGAERARLRLAWRPHTSVTERQRIIVDFERVRQTLEQHLAR